MNDVTPGLIVLAFAVAIYISAISVVNYYSSSWYVFKDVWFPSQYQRELANEYMEYIRESNKIHDAITLAKRSGMDEKIIRQLEEASDNARALIDIAEDEIAIEKRRIIKPDQFQPLIEKWTGKNAKREDET